ncbi:MAG: efflux RND transporter periplasmic adaptor subunit [Bacteroidales bacterium]|nr:efflux RND transporter periplasmic adaptor subunit [Bacteroidales bacterium]
MDRTIEKKFWTTRKILNISAIVVFLVFLIYLLFIRDRRSKLYVNLSQVTIAEVLKDKFQEFIPVDGIVYPKNTIYIDAVQGGIVERVFVEDGELLEDGDTILKLSNPNMELSFMEQETRIYEAINNLQNTKINLERNKYIRQKEIVQLQYEIDQTNKDFTRKKQLYDQKVISDVEFEDARRDYEFTIKQLRISFDLKKLDSIATVRRTFQINNTISRMETNLDMLQLNLDNLYIKTPSDGKLSSFSAEIGETKSAGERLGQIDKRDGYKLKARIDERYISRVYINQPAEFDFSDKTYELEIKKIYSDVTNGSFEVDLLFTNKEPSHIKRGQTIQLKLKFSSPSDATIVKRGGFFQTTGGNWIYVLDESGDAAFKRDIRIGRQNTGYYEVLEGLDPGEKVIVSSYDSFGNKDKLVFRNK